MDLRALQGSRVRALCQEEGEDKAAQLVGR